MNDVMLKVPQATAKGFALVPLGGVFDSSYPESRTRRGRVQWKDGEIVAPTVTACSAECLLLVESIN